jgi:hypothetical protein
MEGDLQAVLEGKDEPDTEAAAAAPEKGADEPPAATGEPGKGEAEGADKGADGKGASPAPEEDDKIGKVIAAQRRELERKHQAEIEELKRQFAADASKKAEEEAAPDPIKDPQGYDRHVQSRIDAAEARVRFSVSRKLADRTHTPEVVTEAVGAFAEAVQRDPSLKVRLGSEEDPYGWVVDWHKAQKTLEQIGDPEKYRERLRQELLADPAFLAEVQKRISDPSGKDDKPTPPPPLATENGGRRPSADDTKDPSLDDILKS